MKHFWDVEEMLELITKTGDIVHFYNRILHTTPHIITLPYKVAVSLPPFIKQNNFLCSELVFVKCFVNCRAGRASFYGGRSLGSLPSSLLTKGVSILNLVTCVFFSRNVSTTFSPDNLPSRSVRKARR